MDQYDKQIEYLLACRDFDTAVWHDWVDGIGLFKPTGPCCGCLTQIRRSNGVSRGPTPELTKAIRADKRIPMLHTGITKKNLPVFAEWQRKIDAGANRGPI